MIRKIKNTVPWTYVISDIDGEEIVWAFYKKKLQRANQTEFGTEKKIKTKDDKLHVKWSQKKILLCNMSLFLEPSTRSKDKLKVKWDLYNYVTKPDLKNVTGIDKSKFAKKADLASLKSSKLS